MLIFRQLFDPSSSTYTYLLGEPQTRQALLIDPVFEQAQRDAALLRELSLHLAFTLETHVHADHITGAWLLREKLGSSIALGAKSGAIGADRLLGEGDTVAFGVRHVSVLETPGHTDGCLTFVADDESMAFTGDCLLIRGCGRTDFQQGDPRRLYASVRQKIFALPDACLLYPAHDYRGLTVTSVAEEKRFNPRLGGDIGEEDFVGYMHNLALPHPKKMEQAVPANLRCGRPEREHPIPQEPSWAHLNYSFSGFWEITPQELEEVAKQVQIIDVREPAEYIGPMGHIAGARLIPLGELKARAAAEIAPWKPVVTVCRAGARSAQALAILRGAGYENVANLAGGMLRWRAEGHAVEGGKH